VGLFVFVMMRIVEDFEAMRKKTVDKHRSNSDNARRIFICL